MTLLNAIACRDEMRQNYAETKGGREVPSVAALAPM